jgi:hypothetical protein
MDDLKEIGLEGKALIITCNDVVSDIYSKNKSYYFDSINNPFKIVVECLKLAMFKIDNHLIPDDDFKTIEMIKAQIHWLKSYISAYYIVSTKLTYEERIDVITNILNKKIYDIELSLNEVDMNNVKTEKDTDNILDVIKSKKVIKKTIDLYNDITKKDEISNDVSCHSIIFNILTKLEITI